MMENNWKDKYDEIDIAPDHFVDEWRIPYKVRSDWFNRDRDYYRRSIEGLYFNEWTWRAFRQTKLTTTPLLKMEDIKPIKIDGSIGKFKWSI